MPQFGGNIWNISAALGDDATQAERPAWAPCLLPVRWRRNPANTAMREQFSWIEVMRLALPVFRWDAFKGRLRLDGPLAVEAIWLHFDGALQPRLCQ